MKWLRSVIDQIHPAKPVRCEHPEYARDYRLRLVKDEQEGVLFYEQCMNCGAEFED